jgi:hypothetical protein
MFRAGILDGKWTGKDGKMGKGELGPIDGKVGRDFEPFSPFPLTYPFSVFYALHSGVCAPFLKTNFLRPVLRAAMETQKNDHGTN